MKGDARVRVGMVPDRAALVPSLGGLPSVLSGPEPSLAEQLTIAEARRQALVIEAEARKQLFAEQKLAQLHAQTAHTLVGIAQDVFAARERARSGSPQLREWVARATEEQLELAKQQVFGLNHAAATAIAREVERTLYLTPERRGFWRRLLG